MQIKKVSWLILLIPCICLGCKRIAKLKEASDKELTLQITDITTPSDQNGSIVYKARLIPSKIFREEKDIDDRTDLIYKMDSCYYLQAGLKKTYPSLVQNIPNGMKGTYEYLLEFEHAPISGKYEFVYQDRYLNHKKYNIEIN